MPEFTLIQKVAIWIIPILFAVTIHEAAHGIVAYKLGDDTAYQLGRISLNPFKHIDLFGTIILPLILMVSSGFIFGWAKPVPVNPYRLRNPKRDTALVGLAGPFSNFLMAIIWMGLLKLSLKLMPSKLFAAPVLFFMSQAGVQINLVLMLLNLLPIPPLDGSRFLSYLLPAPWDQKLNRVGMIGTLLVLLLMVSGILAKILTPPLEFLIRLLAAAFGIT